MPKKIAWITDSSAQLEQDFIEKYNVYVLPLSVILDEVSFREDVDITDEEFYQKLQTINSPPTTSQPAIGEMIALYEKLQADGFDAAIALHVSSGMSGTVDTASSAAKMVDFPVYTIDSKIGSYPMIKMIEHGEAMLQSGKEIEEVVEAIVKMTERGRLAFIPVDLSQLHKSGRVSGSQLFISNLLNIKVIVDFEDGVPVLQEKIRSFKRAQRRVTDLVRKDILAGKTTEVAVIHCNNLKDASSWKEQLLVEFHDLKVKILSLSICVGVHAGEGTTGLSWMQN